MIAKKNAKVEGVKATTALIDAFHDSLIVAKSKRSIASLRCASHPELVDLVIKARDVVDSPTLREHSGAQLIELLESASVVHSIPLTQTSSRKKARLYTVGFNVAASAIQPAELLQAYKVDGILCYFTAIELHALTTQPAPHYHIATLRASTLRSKTATVKPLTSTDRPLPLGSSQFLSHGVPYYLTSREPSNLLGVQCRELNPYCIVTVTNLEQTLLDCLHRPRSSGGAAVVFEAWKNGLERTTPRKLLKLATRIGEPTLLRRMGYMIEHYQPDAAELPDIKAHIQACIAETTYPTLLPGIPYERVSKIWGLRTP